MAPWCHYCRTLEPTFQALANELHHTTSFGKVDCTVQQMIRSRYQVMGFPTLILFHHGKRVEFRGERSMSNLKAFLKKNHATSSGKLTLHTTYYRGEAEPIRLLLSELGTSWEEQHYAFAPAHSPCYWRQTGGCNPKGPREPDHDRHCHSSVPAGASGYCECHDGSRGHEGSCEHGEFRCSTYCVDPDKENKPDVEIFDTGKWMDEGVVFPPGRELPMLLTPEGVALRGALSSMRAMARSAPGGSLYPSDQMVPIEELLALTDDFLRQYNLLIQPKSVTEASARNFHDSLREAVTPFLDRIEHILTTKGNSFLVGSSLTLADLYAFHALSLTLGVLPACLEMYPKTKDYFVEIGMRDSITAYLASPKRLPFANSEDALIGNKKTPEDPAANPFGA